MRTPVYVLLGLGFLLSCSGIDDLIFNRHPQLSDISLSYLQVAPFDTISASIEATNPIDGALDYRWLITHVKSGNSSNNRIVGTNDTDSIRWVAPIQGGIYEFKVIVENTAKSSEKKKQLEVLISDKPVVSMLAPKRGAYFVMNEKFTIEAMADHANGLSWVRAYINGQLIGQKDQDPSDIYRFIFQADSSMVGPALLKVEAKSNYVLQIGADSVSIEIGGIIPGKNGN